jgi:predicted XRE-type DNA-binding protein
MNPYEIDYKKFGVSKKITDPKEILKLELAALFINATEHLNTKEILEKTGLHRSDLSRLRCTSVERFSIDRLVGIIYSVGISLSVRSKKI